MQKYTLNSSNQLENIENRSGVDKIKEENAKDK